VRQVSKSTLHKAEAKSPGGAAAKGKKVKMPKPAWAMTQETAEVGPAHVATGSCYVSRC
jgi:hypothetical protein